MKRTIYTIGHSTRDMNSFLKLLQQYSIKVVADVRAFPGSRKYPHFNSALLKENLRNENIGYHHLPLLGGRRSPLPDSPNTNWRNKNFRGYADYMATDDFKTGIENLKKIAMENQVAIMCSEAVWWRCHRSLIADYLKAEGWQVLHIMDLKSAREHPYTKAAKIINGKLNYSGGQLNLTE